MNTQKTKKRLLALLLPMVFALLLLVGCGSMDSCISGCSVMRSIWSPELVLSEDGAASVPAIEGTLSAEEVSAQLETFYSPIIESIDTANKTEDLFSLEHELVAVDSSNYLHSRIVCSVGGDIDLPRVYIPYAGETQLPEWSVPEQMTDPQDVAAWMELTANDIGIDIARCDEKLTMTALLEMYIGYYRAISGVEMDTSRFADSVNYDYLLKEAMVLGLCGDEYTYASETVCMGDILNATCELLSAMYSDACGSGSVGFTRTDLLEDLRTFLAAGVMRDSEWNKDSSLLVKLINDKLKDAASSGVSELSRIEIASILVELGELMYGRIEDYGGYGDFISDTQDPNAVKALYEGYMSTMLTGGQFCGGYAPGRCDLPELLNSFILGCAYNADMNVWEGSVTYWDALRALSAVDICVRREGLSDTEYIEVNNSRDYDWYYTQHGTGWYSSVNCMPTITMMATKWYDEDTDVTINEMRQRYLPDYSGGWYTWQVAECLTENGVPNEMVEVEEDLLPYLDEGKIILSQMSEAADDESGHCFVIYGYRRRGDTIKFLVHDPDVYDGIDSYGQRPGKAMVLDSRYCRWIIDRIAFAYVVVGE